MAISFRAGVERAGAGSKGIISDNQRKSSRIRNPMRSVRPVASASLPTMHRSRLHAGTSPVQAEASSDMTAFCACSRFSASWKMVSAWASSTSSVISLPR